MKKLLSRIFHGLILVATAGAVFMGSFVYEENFLHTSSSQKVDQLWLKTSGKALVSRMGKDINLGNGGQLNLGDILSTQDSSDLVINFAKDGELRLDKGTKVLVSAVSEQGVGYVFKVLEGRVWLENAYSNADVNLLVDGAVVFPGQSSVYVKVYSGRADISVSQNDAVLGLIATDFKGKKLIDENAGEVINKLYLPQGTMVSVSADKVKENRETIGKLLYSKLVKEFNYSIFDKSELISDLWLSKNVERDSVLAAKIRDERLKDIRTRGVKYSTLEDSNYKIDQTLRDVSNALTFSDKKVGQRNLDALYDLLYDSQYLFDYGRKDEAQERLNTFNSMANQLFLIYGDELKKQYIERVRDEYEYLSFANPGDSLFELRQVLEKIYLDSIKGSALELNMKFVFLTEKISTLGFFAENNDLKNIKKTFDEYMVSFKELMAKNQQYVSNNIVFIQRQNQALDNLFFQHASLYRQNYFTNKLFIENKYLSLLPAGKDKPEEIQGVISQRIDFLRRLQNFFLDGEVPLVDAQNILALLFSEISKIELPANYLVAVTDLFNERLANYGVFSRFLNSPEYVSSSVRGSTPRQRFEQFKADNQQVISIEDLRKEFSAGNDQMIIKEKEATADIAVEPASKPKVSRVKRTD
jgi:hypothetical protein